MKVPLLRIVVRGSTIEQFFHTVARSCKRAPPLDRGFSLTIFESTRTETAPLRNVGARLGQLDHYRTLLRSWIGCIVLDSPTEIIPSKDDKNFFPSSPIF